MKIENCHHKSNAKHLADLQKSVTMLGKCRKTSAKIDNNNKKATIILIFNKSERLAD